MTSILVDLRYAFRLLLKRPGFTFLTVIVLAVCFGLSMYMFTFIHTMAFKPLPFKDGQSIVVFDTVINGSLRGGNSLDALDFEEIRASVKGLGEFVAMRETDVNVSGRDRSQHYIACSTEAALFSFTRVQPLLGRSFTDAEDDPGAERVVLISHEIWTNDFAGDPYVLDEIIRVDGLPTRIIGVMPPGFHFPRNSDLWLPLRLDTDRIQRGSQTWVMGVARLQPGVTADQANREVAQVMEQLAAEYPETNSNVSALFSSFPWTQMGDGGILIVGACYSAAVLLLLLGIINVGNLLLSRALERDRETATRIALGAPLGRLVLQMMWESLLIVFAAGLIGLLLAAWGLELLNSAVWNFSEDNPYYWWSFGIDGFSMMIFVPMIMIAVLLAGALPAWRVARGNFSNVLRDGTRGAHGRFSGRLSRSLVVAEVLLSVTILVAASVTMIGAYRASHMDYGARVENIFTSRIAIPRDRYPTATDQAGFAEDVRRTLIRNGVTEAVAIMSSLPGTYTEWPRYEVENRNYPDDMVRPSGQLSTVLPASLDVIGVTLLAGRFFDSRDSQEGLPTAIISASMAQANWPGESALGKRFRIMASENNSPWLTVVGIIKNTTHTQPFGRFSEQPAFFLPMTQFPGSGFYVAFPSQALPQDSEMALGKTLFEIDPDVPAFYPATYEKRVSYLTGGISFLSQVFVLLGIVAVLLAGSGIFGVMSNSVTQNTHEIGVKRALGATDRRVYMDYFKAARRQLLLGAIPGMAIGGGIGYMMAALVDNDVLALASMMVLAPLFIAAIVMIATWLPVKRALSLEPSEALHHE
jgi:predicted permease